MGVIYRIINTKTKAVLSVGATTDLNEITTAVNRGEWPRRHSERLKYKDCLNVEVLEETDCLAERLAHYIWPQIRRVSYDSRLLSASLEKGMKKRVNNAVDYMIFLFPNEKYSFVFGLTEDRHITADVLLDGDPFERYVLKRSGEPQIREYIGK